MGQATVHIVSTHTNVREHLRSAVIQAGAEVHTYAELPALLEQPISAGIALIEDGRRPGTIIKRIRAAGRAPVPIVLAAKEPRTECVIAALTGGALDYFEIPVMPRDFEERLTAAIAKAERQRARHSEIEDARERLNASASASGRFWHCSAKDWPTSSSPGASGSVQGPSRSTEAMRWKNLRQSTQP